MLVRKLVKGPQRVRALVLPGEDYKHIENLGAEMVQGNVLDPDSLQRAMQGVKVVYHLAGVIAIVPGREKLMWKVNVVGARLVAEVALNLGIRRLVHVGSVHAFHRRPGEAVDEEAPLALTAPRIHYDRTKAEGIAAVLEVAKKGLDVVVACPSGIIGPYDYLGSEMGRLVGNLARRGLHFLVEGGFDFVDVRDVAEGLIKAAAKGRRGEIYILSGTYVSLAELHELVGRVAQTRSTHIILPTALALAVGRVMPYYYRLSQTTPQITAYSVQTVCEKCRFTHKKAARELGFHPRPLFETIEDALAWQHKPHNTTQF